MFPIVYELKGKIDAAIRPLIDFHYHLLEVPYYSNVGDSLIWQGELDFLKTIPYKCKSMHSLETFRFKGIERNDVILFQGGGNFGDVWTRNHDFKMSVVRAYPENKIVFFPQSVWFQYEDNARRCAEELRRAPNVTICVRDSRSYGFMKRYFCNDIKLVPDMAFYMDMAKWNIKGENGSDVVLLRNDIEYRPTDALDEILTSSRMTVSDWPAMVDGGMYEFVLSVFKQTACHFPFVIDKYAEIVYKKHIIDSGVRFLKDAGHVYTTRLHGAILAFMMGKRVTVFENSYGKIGDFFRTWIPDNEMITLEN